MGKRLLNINNYHYRRGGSDVVYLELAELMASRGWSNAYFSMHHPKNLETAWSRFFVEELEFGQAYGLVDKLRMASKVIYSREAQLKLRALLSEFRPDIAHLHCIYHHLSPSILPVLTEAGIPAVMTAHDLKLACPAYKMLNADGICERCKNGTVLNVIRHRCIKGSLAASAIVAAESALQRKMDTYRKHLAKVIAPSRFFLEKLVEWGWDRGQVVYIPNYVDVSKFEPKFEDGSYFVYFGRLSEEKGLATLIDAAGATKLPLKIVGTGPLDEVLRERAKSLPNVEFLGYRTGHELWSIVDGAIAVVLPSEWYENAPMSVLESYAAGKPVIGAAIGGIPELVLDGETGWHFTSGDAGQLASRLELAARSSASQRREMGFRAREFVSQQFTKARYAGELESLYRKLQPSISA